MSERLKFVYFYMYIGFPFLKIWLQQMIITSNVYFQLCKLVFRSFFYNYIHISMLTVWPIIYICYILKKSDIVKSIYISCVLFCNFARHDAAFFSMHACCVIKAFSVRIIPPCGCQDIWNPQYVTCASNQFLFVLNR